jgi:hypothetical protein
MGIISTNTEKDFDEIQCNFMTKVLKKLEMEGSSLNIIKTTYDSPIVNITLNGEKVRAYPLETGMRQGCSLSPFLSNIMLEILVRAIRPEEIIKRTQISEEKLISV